MLLSNTSLALQLILVLSTTCTCTDPLPVTFRKVVNENHTDPSEKKKELLDKYLARVHDQEYATPYIYGCMHCHLNDSMKVTFPDYRKYSIGLTA